MIFFCLPQYKICTQRWTGQQERKKIIKYWYNKPWANLKNKNKIKKKIFPQIQGMHKNLAESDFLNNFS